MRGFGKVRVISVGVDRYLRGMPIRCGQQFHIPLGRSLKTMLKVMLRVWLQALVPGSGMKVLERR